ncbi:hypothetical protein ACFQHV_08565 [Promicromonospora thailandica]|uniref:NERD domain-containing protein n=1 Tax=Promicromonospora thailandica TaxID=765201 RepID=A0A9X2G6H1_9MICO|nr:hypothetical protein [Promicromonospora thailandica]MCP2266618.1 hypothetical protein [Promicromonospora thailandica]BFF17305.1 hypothetical protein GCM10025730_08260 [Promicromonospora thailandica]
MGTDSPSVPLTVSDALPNLRVGRLSRADDLTHHRPAKHLIAQRRTYRRQHLASLVRGRLRGGYDPRHRALSRRIVGVRGVASELWELVAKHPAWRVLHSVRTDAPTRTAQGAGAIVLDDVVIGPAGVFTVQAVYRPVEDVTADAAREAARRAQEILNRATRVPVTVRALIVFVRSDQPRVVGPRDDVEVLTEDELVPWLESRRPMLTDRELEIVYLAARDRRTWSR